MKRITNLRLMVLLLALLAGWTVASAYDFEEGGIYYNVNDDGTTVTVTKDTESPYFGDVVIPDEVTHDGITYSVTAIGDMTFSGCTELTGIVIGDSVSSIGRFAFAQCTNLTNVTVGLSVPSLRVKKQNRIFNAFTGCENITSLTWRARNCTDLGEMVTANFQHVILGDQVEVIPNFFAQGSQITEITIPNSVTTIGNSAFDGCSSLSGTLSIPNSVTRIGNSAFSGCSGLTGELAIPNSVTSIGSSAFSGCSGLTGELTIPNSVTDIGSSAFNGCSGLTGELTIPNSVTVIGSQAFADCVGITAFNMGNAITSIGNEAFLNCLGITEISIPNSVVQIGIAAFEGCENLGKVNISSLEAWCGIDFETPIGSGFDLYPSGSSNPLFLAHHLYLNGQEIKDLVIPNSIADINNYAFIGGSEFTSVTFGDDVATIGNYAFKGCTGLTNLILGDAITQIGTEAFSGCTGVTNVTLGNSIVDIDYGVFHDCTSLTSLTISKSVTYLENMIQNCPSLTSLKVESGNPVYDSREDCNAIIETATNTLVVGCPTTVIPNTVTAIGDYAFQDCNGLTSIVIPNSVTSIGFESFFSCKDLTEVFIPNSVTSIGAVADYNYNNDTTYTYNPFDYCSSLRTIIVESDNPIYDSRNNCNAIIETASNTLKCGCNATLIPNTVTAISDNAFLGSGVTVIDIPNSVTTIGESAFGECRELTTIHIPNSVTTIGDYAFFACLDLKEVTIPNSVIVTKQYTANQWFSHCWSLERVTLGSGIGYMGALFNDCPNIRSVTCLATTPPIFVRYYKIVDGNQIIVYNFDDVVFNQATIYVPAISLEAYQTTIDWMFFQNIRPLGDFDGDGDLGISDVSSLIDYLLTEDANGMDLGAADADGNGKVEIADLSVLIDMLLNL